MRAHFAKKTPPLKEKLDPVKVKRTINQLQHPPAPPSDSNYDRILKKTYAQAVRSGTTSSDARLEERRSRKTIPELDIVVANHLEMVPGTNPDDYLGDDVRKEQYKYVHGKPLVKPGHPALTTMMHRLHEWYMKTCRESRKNTMYVAVKPEHEFIRLPVIPIQFEELFQLYNQLALDKQLMTSYCL